MAAFAIAGISQTCPHSNKVPRRGSAKVSEIVAYPNCDMATIAWRTSGKIDGCRGFALERQVRGPEGDAKSGFVNTWVGFKGQSHKTGESRSSAVWPVQRYLWSDYVVSFGQQVRYRVIPMIGKAANLEQAPTSNAAIGLPG